MEEVDLPTLLSPAVRKDSGRSWWVSPGGRVRGVVVFLLVLAVAVITAVLLSRSPARSQPHDGAGVESGGVKTMSSGADDPSIVAYTLSQVLPAHAAKTDTSTDAAKTSSTSTTAMKPASTAGAAMAEAAEGGGLLFQSLLSTITPATGATTPTTTTSSSSTNSAGAGQASGVKSSSSGAGSSGGSSGKDMLNTVKGWQSSGGAGTTSGSSAAEVEGVDSADLSAATSTAGGRGQQPSEADTSFMGRLTAR